MAIPVLPGGLIIYQGHLFALTGHLCFGLSGGAVEPKAAGGTAVWRSATTPAASR